MRAMRLRAVNLCARTREDKGPVLLIQMDIERATPRRGLRGESRVPSDDDMPVGYI
jgi:hypothetical protein